MIIRNLFTKSCYFFVIILYFPVTAQVSEYINQALYFDGSANKAVNIPHSKYISFSDTSKFTIEVWFMPTAENSGYYHILGKRNGIGHSELNYQLAKDPPSQLAFISDAEPVSTLYTPPLNEWTHITVTFDGSLLRIYLNGELNAATPYTMHGETSVPLQIGNSGGLWCYFIGYIDEVRMWNIVRTADEIANYYNRIVNPNTPGLIGYWNFDESQSEQKVTDNSPLGNHGCLGTDKNVNAEDPARVISTVPFLTSNNDAAVLNIIAPDSIVILNSSIKPKALIQNCGLDIDTIKVHFKIGSIYHDQSIIILDAMKTDTVAFKEWKAAPLGIFHIECYTNLPNDVYTGNDTLKSMVTILADTTGPAIFNITPNSCGNIGTITITVNGKGFQIGSTAKLVREGYQDNLALATIVLDSEKLLANFDITDTSIGTWDLMIQTPNGTSFVLPQSFNLEEGYVNLWTELLGRQQVRAGRDFLYKIKCENSGNVTVRRALIEVTAIGGLLDTPMPSAFEERLIPFAQDTLHFILLDFQPGAVVSFPVYLRVGTALYIDLQVKCFDASTISNGRDAIGVFEKTIITNNNIQSLKYPGYSVNLDVEPDNEMDGAFFVNSGPTTHCGILVHYINGWFVAENLDKTIPTPTTPSGFRLTPWQIYVDRMKSENNKVYGVNIPMDDGQKSKLTEWCLNEARNPRLYDPFSWKCTDPNSEAYRVGADYAFPKVDPLTTPAELFLELTGILPNDLFPPIVYIVGGIGLVLPYNDINWIKLKLWIANQIWRRYLWPQLANSGSPIQVTNSWDPNEKIGPIGFGESKYIPSKADIEYFIFFENIESATAAAQEISIIDTLDSSLDWSSFIFGDLQIGDQVLTIRNIGQNLDQILNLNDTTNVIINGTITSGIVNWHIVGRDTRTGELGDILPSNKMPPEGEGFVSLSIKPKSILTSGTIIKNRASILFDYNKPILTNYVINTIDALPPTSQVQLLAQEQVISKFEAKWNGEDDDIGSGIGEYSIYVSDNGGKYQEWITTDKNSSIFNGENGHTYQFYSIARDNVGNIESKPQTFDANTTVKLLCGIAVSPNPFVPSRGHTVISFFGDGLPFSKIKIFDKAGERVKTLEEKEGNDRLDWDANNENGEKIASGVYIWVATNQNGKNEKGKLAIIK